MSDYSIATDAVIAGTFLALNIGKKEMLEPMAGAIGAMFDNPSDPFFTGRAMDIAFDGIPVNCGTEHPVAKGVCESFAAQPAMRKIDDQHYAFSLFGGVSSANSICTTRMHSLIPYH